MKGSAMFLLVTGVVCAFAAATVSAEEPGCTEISSDARFVDLHGNTVQLASVDPITMKELDAETVLVYRRTADDAQALVETLEAEGESDPALLQPETWLMAQPGPSCKMVAGSCKGNCLGKQKCKKVKKIGKNECTCML